MQEQRILELIVYLLQELDAGTPLPLEINDLTINLVEQGYSEYEIGIALSWVMDNFQTREMRRETIDNDAVRILNEIERYLISPEIYGYLTQMKQLQLITNTQLEIILEQLFLDGHFPLDLNHVKHSVAQLLIQMEPYESKFNHKFIFKGSETIN